MVGQIENFPDPRDIVARLRKKDLINLLEFNGVDFDPELPARSLIPGEMTLEGIVRYKDLNPFTQMPTPMQVQEMRVKRDMAHVGDWESK